LLLLKFGMPLEIETFSSDLKRLVGNSEGFRPLLCRGNPLTCKVAIVGANPATKTPFWPYWSSCDGVDKDAWLDASLKEHGGKYGRSRAAIERLLPLLNSRAVELNAHAKQSARLAELGSQHRTSEVLHFVLQAVRPRVALCAGADASKAVKQVGQTGL
jgi:hypothetical protein